MFFCIWTLDSSRGAQCVQVFRRMSIWERAREELKETRRLVIKVGSRALASHQDLIPSLTKQIARQRDKGRDVVLVSSGAVAVGVELLGMPERPKDLATIQAVAATGQSRLIRRYEHAFRKLGYVSSQMLLTHADLADRERYVNIRRCMEALLDLGVVPVVNENDALTAREITFGDNDQLASMVSTIVGADTLLLLTNTPGVLDKDGERLDVVAALDDVRPHVEAPDEVAEASAQSGDGKAVQGGSPGQAVGSGGMVSKVEAAARAAEHGVSVVIGQAWERDIVDRVLSGEDLGTLFLPKDTPLASRKHWIVHTLRAKGVLTVDGGASRALREQGSSLLAVGVTHVEGEFDNAERVDIHDQDGVLLGCGLIRLRADELRRVLELEEDLRDPVVHRNDMVVWRSSPEIY